MSERLKKISFETPIFLVGFMGAGKTTVGRTLARMMSRDFIDLDELIEARAKKSVREIFAEFGEAHFRQLERQAIKACGDLQNTIVALGGGAYIAEENRKILREIGKTIWLNCPLEICLARIVGDGSRPLAKSEKEMGELLEKRLPAYAEADFTVQTEAKTAERLAAEIIELF
jgi:shikimate kinase